MAGGAIKIVISAIAGNSFITIIKFIGWGFSKSPSLLAEAIHSFADTLNQILLLIGLKQSNAGSTREHPTGSGGVRYIWNLISAVGVFFLGFGVTAYHGMHALVSGHYEVGPLSWIGIGVLIVAFIIEFYVFLAAYKEVNSQRGDRGYLQFIEESDDPTLVAVLLEDGVAVLGVIFALVGITLGQIFQSALFDIFASLAIALLLGVMAVMLAFINGKLLVGKSAPVHKEDEIKSFIEGLASVDKVVSLSTQIIGAGKVRLSLEVELQGELIIDQSALIDDAKKIAEGARPIKILHKSNERMLRLTGSAINKIELSIQDKFSEISIIDFEIN
jgi:solute carrier family 30 (zinc transporter), member 9